MNEERLRRFQERYAEGDMPWDSGITPPEIMEILAELPVGRALDLGCGTGTVLRDLIEAGWKADGIDYVKRAIDLAAAKLRPYAAEGYQLFRHDVTEMETLANLRAPYDLIIDIGCGHSIDKNAAQTYAHSITERLASGGIFMLYASHPRPDSPIGWSPEEVLTLFTPGLELVWHRQGTDSAIGVASSWYRIRKPRV